MNAAAAESISLEQKVAESFGLRRNPFVNRADTPDPADGEILSRCIEEVHANLLEGHLLTLVTGSSRARQTEFADRLAKTFGEEIRFLSLHGNKLSFAAPGSSPRFAAPARLHQSIESIEFVVASAIRQAAHIDRAGLLVDYADALDEDSLLTLLDFIARFRSQQPPVQLVLAGTESILQALTDAVCARFGDLTARHFSLDRVTREEARSLIAERLERAGGKRELFPDAAVDVAHELTNGYVDSLLGLASWTLWLADERECRVLTTDLVREAAESAIVRPAAAGSAEEPADRGGYEVFQPGKLTAFTRPVAEPLRLPARTGPSAEVRQARREKPPAEPATMLRDVRWIAAAATASILAIALGWTVWQADRWDGGPQAVVSDTPSRGPDTGETAIAPAEQVAEEPALEELPAADPALVEPPVFVDIPRNEARVERGDEQAQTVPETATGVAPGGDVAALLAEAQGQFEERKLTTPPGDNARETWLEVLDLEPSHAGARQGLERIEATYLRWADEAEGRERWNEARIYYRRAQRLSPEDASIAEAIERVLERESAESAPVVVDNQQQDTTLISAVRDGDVVALAEAFSAGAAVDTRDERGKTAMMWAAELGAMPIVRELEAQGADPNLVADSGDTALMYAAQDGHADIVRYLIDNGGAVDQTNGLGWTALMYASVGGHDAAVRELLARGADVNALSQERKSPLMAAARNGHAAVVRSLAEAGARVNQMDRSGWTALMYAAWQGHTDVTDALLAGAANLDVRNAEGQTALTLGIVRRNREVIDRLVQAGAQR